MSPTSVQPGGPGRGIAQWSTGARWNVTRSDNVAWYANKLGASVHSLDLQLAFIWFELETFSQYGLSSLRSDPTQRGDLCVSKGLRSVRRVRRVQRVASHRIAYARAVLTA